MTINASSPLEANCGDGIVTYFQLGVNLLLPLSFNQAVLSVVYVSLRAMF